MTTPLTEWPGLPVLDVEGKTIGTVTEVFLDNRGGPRWLEASERGTGRAVILPAEDATVEGDGQQAVHVPLPIAMVSSAPDVPRAAEGLTRAAESQLTQHYHRDWSEQGSEADGEAEFGAGAEETEIIRSEEELRVETEVAEVGRVRVKKWVDTETVSEEVELRQEHLRLERESLTVNNVDDAIANAQIGELEIEVVLRDEQVVASKITVPQEVVRVTKEVVVEQVLVEADLRKERVEIHGDRAADRVRQDEGRGEPR